MYLERAHPAFLTTLAVLVSKRTQNNDNFYRVSENEGQIENGYKTLKIRVLDPE